MLAGGAEQARRTLSALQSQADVARSATGDPTWRAAGYAPYGGDDLAAVRDVATAVDDLALFGEYAVIRAEGGKVQIVKQGAASELGIFDGPVSRLDPDIHALYTNLIATYPADVNLTPHFPTAAALFREMYRRRSGSTVNGVLATDPVTVAYLTGATVAMVPVAYQPASPPALTATTDAEGRFSITFTAHWPGVWRITATGRESGVTASTLLTVASRQLPVTGGSSLGTQIGIGAGLLALGMVLIMLTVVRRRRNGLRAGAA